MSNASQPRWFRPGEGDEHTIIGLPHVFKVVTSDTQANCLVLELLLKPGQGIPPHVHDHEDEFFCVTKGTLTFELEGSDEPIEIGPGAVVSGPRGFGHGYRNTGTDEARVVVTIVPGTGAERMFREMHAISLRGLDPQSTFRESLALCGRYGIRFVDRG